MLATGIVYHPYHREPPTTTADGWTRREEWSCVFFFPYGKPETRVCAPPLFFLGIRSAGKGKAAAVRQAGRPKKKREKEMTAGRNKNQAMLADLWALPVCQTGARKGKGCGRVEAWFPRQGRARKLDSRLLPVRRFALALACLGFLLVMMMMAG